MSWSLVVRVQALVLLLNMGSRVWVEVVSWAGSLQNCLDAAHRRLLASDDILEILGTRSQIEARAGEIRDIGISEMLDMFEAALARYDVDGRPQTAADVHALLGIGDHGTGSILDVSGISESPRRLDDPPSSEFEFLISPLPEASLVDLFGTTSPTLEQVDEYDLVSELVINDGRYITITEHEHPVTVVFIGSSRW